MQDYRRLIVCRKAHALALNVQRTATSFSRAGHAGLRSQITRAAESVPANIVEGCFASTQKEFGRFLDIGIKSAGELEYQLQLARDYGLVSQHSWQVLAGDTIEVRRMLLGLRRKVLAPELSQSSSTQNSRLTTRNS